MSEKAGEIYYDIEADVSGLLKAQGKANKSLDSIGNSATNAAKKMDELQTNINRVAGAIAASLVVDWGKAFLVAADNMSQLNARIERLTGSAATASQTMQSLMRISSATGGSLQDTAKLWETLSTAFRDDGATTARSSSSPRRFRKSVALADPLPKKWRMLFVSSASQFHQEQSVRRNSTPSLSKCRNWRVRSPPGWA